MTEGKRVRVTSHSNPEYGREGTIKLWCSTTITVLLDGNPEDWVNWFRREDIAIIEDTLPV